ncbi:glycerophosphodiester phosphodiesterase [Streptomyces sp. H27-D2]|uniref:glycerophosphodiester phosphodiesterase n=1 Tax=Streptomyces sp. H27-D2 TaxID=3046304 RepID=UPI002DB59407|nr:glycerophosphodiester phosphodiesterase [Streptomyces sp. H27-D2]MEC4018883.1 glycerophosphodiester phosphodiesterase [Streptomyces sp. H27-D2]
MTYARPAQDVRPGPHTTAVVAHRGASEEVPEHTLAAYRKAIEDGADALECDIRLTADGHLVCVHDRRVNRTSNGRGAVSTLELSDLSALDFGSWKGHATDHEAPDLDAPHLDGGGCAASDLSASPPGATAPYGLGGGPRPPGGADRERTSVLTLERLLELVADAGRPVELAIETKHPTRWAGQVEDRLLGLLRRYDLADPPAGSRSPVRVMSFSARSLHRVRAAAPALPTVYLMPFVTPRHRDGKLPPGVTIAGPSMRIIRAHPEYVARAHRAGHRVHVWTVNEPEDVELCARLGVDAVITNRPKQVLNQLGRP